MDPFDNELAFRITGDSLTGVLRRRDGKGTTLPVRATPGLHHRFKASGIKPEGDLTGTYDCDGYVMHGDTPETIGGRIRDMKERREKKGLPPLQFGVAAYSIIRNTGQAVKKELDRITNVKPGSPGYLNYQQWLSGTQLEQKVSLEDYSVSNRGLRSGLVGTPAQVEDQIGAFEKAGVDFFLLQCSPQLEEMERFADQLIRKNHLAVQE